MLDRILADIVVLLHLLWIVFLVAGGAWGRKRRAVMAVHAAGLLFSVVSQAAGWYCPLTHLEAWLRRGQDPLQAYPGSFIAHYAERLVYLEVSPSALFAATIGLVLFNARLYRAAFGGKGREQGGPPRQ